VITVIRQSSISKLDAAPINKHNYG